MPVNKICVLALGLLSGCASVPAAQSDNVVRLPTTLRDIVAATQSATVDEMARMLGQVKVGDINDPRQFITQDGYLISSIGTIAVNNERLTMNFLVGSEPCFSVDRLGDIADVEDGVMSIHNGVWFYGFSSDVIAGAFTSSDNNECVTGAAFGRRLYPMRNP